MVPKIEIRERAAKMYFFHREGAKTQKIGDRIKIFSRLSVLAVERTCLIVAAC
jgi:hypothetical protein